jgi:integrase
MSDYLVWNVIYPEAPESYHENPEADPHWEWQKDPEVREEVRPQVAELARVATFLASEGKVLNSSAYALFVDAVSDNLLPAILLLERRANGDYSRDHTPESFPSFTDGPARGTHVGCWDLFEAFVKATKPADKTVSRWRAVFLEMQREFAEVGAEGLTEDAARKWVHGLITPDRSASTVREIWLSASRRVFGWGCEHKRIRQNPFADVKVDVPRRARTRETGKSFTTTEAQTILRAALSFQNPKTPMERGKRWVPWLCAYSGARSGEVAQLRGSVSIGVQN